MYFSQTKSNVTEITMKDDLIVYDITIDPAYSNGKDLSISQIGFVTKPAVLTRGFLFNEDQSRQMIFKDESKMRLAAPAMIPMTIYRNDEFGEYYVRFTEEVIEQLFVKLMKNLTNKGVFNTEHDPSQEAPAFILEAWLVGQDNLADRSYSEFGIKVPKGTLFIVAQVTDKEYYNTLVKENRTGFSIEGFLGMKLSEILKSEFNINKQTMNKIKLPDGEHLIEDKIYVVKDGVVVEVKDKPAEEAAMSEDPEEEKKEEVAMEEEVKDEVKDEVKEEETAMAIDETELMTILQPKFDEIYALIADLKVLLETEKETEVETEVPATFSVHQRFANVVRFVSDND